MARKPTQKNRSIGTGRLSKPTKHIKKTRSSTTASDDNKVRVVEGAPKISKGELFGGEPASSYGPRWRGVAPGVTRTIDGDRISGDLVPDFGGAFGMRASAAPLRILCVHGVGHQESDPNFRPSWNATIENAIRSVDPTCAFVVDFFEYDDLVDDADTSALAYAAALTNLLSSFVVNGVGDTLRGTRGLGDIPDEFKRSVGMVAHWVANENLRATLRSEIIKALASKEYHAVLAHSLGSLICYDSLVHNPGALKDKTFVTFGSQIGHPAIRDIFAGRIQIPDVGRWFHLFNPEDNVLTARIRIIDDRFKQVDEPFDIPNDLLNHDATWYLSHHSTVDTVWRALAGAASSSTMAIQATRDFRAALRKPDKRALLIGINEYPDPKNRLEGCVNDVFTMSSLLQESGFTADEIRVVLNSRATTQEILDRLHWLLDGVKAEDQRFLFYSGHGAQIPGYDATGEPDHIDECLVPYDFDWSPAHAIIDKQFSELYSQLSYESWFVAVFDCCHSGGISRAGGPLVRGLTPPDDIRHRDLQWNAQERMWVARDIKSLNKSLLESSDGMAYLGKRGVTRRLGRASMLRTLANREYDQTRKALNHLGPYLPIILGACGEDQLSYEYRDGVTSYGAYTFCLAQTLRAYRDQKNNLSFIQLSDLVKQKLHRLNYSQIPEIVGAKAKLKQEIPWLPPRSVKRRQRA